MNKKVKKGITWILILILIILLFTFAFIFIKLKIEDNFRNEFKNTDKGETKKFESNDEGIDNSSIFKIYSLKQKAYKEGIHRHYYGTLKIPSVNIEEKIYQGANKYTLALGVATDFYEDSVPGKGNFVLVGHNFGIKDVLLSNLSNVEKDQEIEVKVGSDSYKYKIISKELLPSEVILNHGEIENDSPFRYPKLGEKPKITIYTCEPHGITNKRWVVQGEFID